MREKKKEPVIRLPFAIRIVPFQLIIPESIVFIRVFGFNSIIVFFSSQKQDDHKGNWDYCPHMKYDMEPCDNLYSIRQKYKIMN